jgi:hypothetical protein
MAAKAKGAVMLHLKHHRAPSRKRRSKPAPEPALGESGGMELGGSRKRGLAELSREWLKPLDPPEQEPAQPALAKAGGESGGLPSRKGGSKDLPLAGTGDRD